MIQAIMWVVAVVLAIVLAFLLFWKFVFLRDPEITVPKGNVIVSPASGTVLKIMDLDWAESALIKKGLMGKIITLCSDVSKSCYIISIFMSPLDVHIQRASLSGKVIKVEHKNGTLGFTGSFENGITNEKTETLIENSKIGRFKIIQIAGFVVKRIENWVKKGQMLEKGQKIGLINFGSQVSIILPKKDNIHVVVSEGMHVDSGRTIIAEVK